MILTSSEDGHCLRCWQICAGKARCLGTIKGKGGIRTIAVSRDGKYIGAETLKYDDASHYLHVWDAVSGKELFFLQVPCQIEGLNLSPDGKRIVWIDGDNIVRIWDVRTGKKIREWFGDRFSCTLTFSPDGRYLAAATWKEKVVRVWDSSTGKKVHDLHADIPIKVMCNAIFSGTNTIVACADGAGHENGSLLLWDVATGKLLGRRQGHTTSMGPLAVDGAGGWLATSGDKELFLWEWASRRRVYRIGFDDWKVWEVALSRDGRWLAASLGNGETWKIIVWEMAP